MHNKISYYINTAKNVLVSLPPPAENELQPVERTLALDTVLESESK